MSSLLEVKSSMIRQVQGRPAARRKLDQPDVQGPASAAWPGSGVETVDVFAQMRQVLRTGESRRGRGLPHPEVVLRSGSPPPAEPVDPARGLAALSPEEVEMLYQDALYTVLHRAGTMDPHHVDDQEALLLYLQQVFHSSPEEHAKALEHVQKAKAPTYALKVSVMRAKNLLAKDPNGFSDPYCMLGIVPATGTLQEPSPHKEQRFSFRKGSKRGGQPPTKWMQVTEVKSSTLNPVWEEHFLFEIEDVSGDQLHLDIWDHDDEVTLGEACRKLNEVIGLKGMSRYFKQIVKSARANGTGGSADDHSDDFLGCLNIPVREVPVAGEDRWFRLEPRSSASRVQGDCQLVLKLITTQRDTAMSQSGRSGFLSYLLLLSRLLQFELGAEQANPSSWQGELSGAAATVLCLHGAQNDLSPLQLAVLHWQVSSRHHQTCTLDYSYLLGLLEEMQALWEEAASLAQDQEESLAHSFSAFSEFGLQLLRGLRDYFPAANSRAVDRLEQLLRCLSKLQLFRSSLENCPSVIDLSSDITAAIKKGNRDWFDRLLDAKSPRKQLGPQRLAGLVELADALYEDLQSCYSVYDSIFRSIIKMDFFILTFRQLEQLVAEETWVLTKELSPKMTLEVASKLFELYLTLADLQRLWDCVPDRDSSALALADIHVPFLPAVKLWLQALQEQVKCRLQSAVEGDTLEPTDTSSKHSSSAATASLCFSHTQELWVRLAWPDPAQAQELGTQLSQDLCEAALFYTEQLRRKADAEPGAAGCTLSEQLCVVLNNVEFIRKAAGQALRGLAWLEGSELLQGGLPRPLLSCSQALDEDLQREAHTVTAHLTSKMVGDIRKFVQHVGLSPDSIQNEEAVAPLLKYLDEKLALLNASLVKGNLSRVLEALWELLLQAILQALGANHDASADFYERFHFTLEALVNFFHAEGQGLPLESLRDGSYKNLEEELRLHQCSTRECIEQYYLDKLKQAPQNRFGRLNVRCHYEVAEQRLVVAVLHAADLPPLDANGLSDPFVIVELGPPHLFPMIRSQRTQVKSRTLHPVFDELFHFSVPAEACRRRAACVLFTVMDHDWLSSNDFAGEAALGLGSISGVARPQVGGGLRAGQPITLYLRRPRAQVRSALRMLEGRPSKEAQDFVRRLKELEKSMEADP
ncbi:BAI1-associated protein 3 [Suncus etruscus]|uniref:BAI1-associated protein 3 n=1 Tax=Suncus etruscus TaxID=109475 RepID=UPI00210FBE05|nr:BAI1-associated protein 3 [Suncus etruscus]